MANIYTSSGAITQKKGFVVLLSGTSLTMTLSAPNVGGDDGNLLTILSANATLNTVTVDGGVFPGGLTTITYEDQGANIVLIAFAGTWNIYSQNGMTLS